MIPKNSAQPTNRKPNRYLAFGFVMRLTHFEPPSVEMADFSMIPIMVPTIRIEIPNGTGCWKGTRKSCIAAMLPDMGA